MKIFVASWFYVPVTTSEALVTYKLFSNSKNEYYVCSANSNKWSYNTASDLKSDNIHQYIIETDNLEEFNEKALEKFNELKKKIKFDAFMTRSLPPEVQKIGLKIKKENPNLPWIASLADPIANNPYETQAFFLNSRRKIVRKWYSNAPHFFLNRLCPLVNRPIYKKMSSLNKLERDTLDKADVVITPNDAQARFIMYNEEIYKQKSLVVPHSYDTKLYKNKKRKKNDKYTFTFLGNSDALRSLEPIVRAVKELKDLNHNIIDKIHFRFVGNVPQEIKDMIYVFFLNDIISCEKPCNYLGSLEIMQESDCLIHIDASFPHLQNGSIFFAAKIADYLGSGVPIMGITDVNSPAYKIITSCGGVCCGHEINEIAKTIVNIVNNPPVINREEAKKYDAINVAKDYDNEIEKRIQHD